jgi:AraC family transcriptional regulator
MWCLARSAVQEKSFCRRIGQRQGGATGGLFNSNDRTQTGRVMDGSNSSHQNPRASASGASPPELPKRQMPSVDYSPAEVVKRQTAHWRGVRAETEQVISHEDYEVSFKHHCHLLIAVEEGTRYDGETLIEGLPASTLRNYSHRMNFVPAERRFSGWQNPRLLKRSISLYIDPQTVLVDPDLRFAEADLQPGLLFEDSGLWEAVRKLKARIGSTDPADRMYADALGGVLAHELLRIHGTVPASRPIYRGGLAGWQQRRVMDFMERHLAEDISLNALADLVRLSPYHFLRSFKRSFGEPPHRYWTGRRIECAKALLADPRVSITEIAFNVGFGGSSAFSATFHRITGQTPTDYRRSLE